VASAEYDRIGRTYRAHRRADPRLARQVLAALGDAASVVNVGAGAGSYEPDDGRLVIAVEPSATMRAQRPEGAAPCVAGVAGALPFADGAFDAAMTVLSLHHWPEQRAGLDELRRVAGRQVVLTFEPSMHSAFWVVSDYLPEVVELPGSRPLAADVVAEHLGGRVEVVPVPADCQDGFFTAFWKRPEAYLDPVVRAGISACSQLPAEVVDRAMARLAADLADGSWAARHADLLDRDEIDGGYRLVVADAPGR
jgi:SAM-dependent methyltransferase